MGYWTAIEIPESRQRAFATPGEEHSFTLEYLVTWTATSAGDTYPGDQELPLQVPRIRRRLPSAVYGSDYQLKSYVCRSVEFSPVRERPYTWRASLRYGTYLTNDDYEFISVTRNTQLRTTPVWRMPDGFGNSTPSWSTFFPTYGDQSWPPAADMGHERVDMMGNPRSYEVVQQQVTYEYLWDRTKVSGGSPQAEPPTATWSGYVNYRNNADWFGFPRGTLRYMGFQIAPINEWYRIQQTFLYDRWFHLEQFMGPVPTGAPICTSGTTVMGLVVLQADKVGWFQRYPSLGAGLSFNDLIPLAEAGQITTPQPPAV
jgi:hypothetical protein